MGASYSDPDQFIKWYYEDKSRLAQIEAVVVEEQAVDALLAEATVTDKSVSFEDFMRPESAQAPAAAAG